MASRAITAKPGKRDGAVYSAVITLKNGRKLYASSYGLKAFRFYPKSAKRKPLVPTTPGARGPAFFLWRRGRAV